jgi:hypothetical protein
MLFARASHSPGTHFGAENDDPQIHFRGSMMKQIKILLVALAIVSLAACGLTGLQSGPHSGVVGKWRSADGSYVVEFLPSGECSAHYRMHGQELGGPCKYTVDTDAITIHYYGLNARPLEGPNATATWHYTLAGDTLNVSVFGNSLALQRVH